VKPIEESMWMRKRTSMLSGTSVISIVVEKIHTHREVNTHDPLANEIDALIGFDSLIRDGKFMKSACTIKPMSKRTQPDLCLHLGECTLSPPLSAPPLFFSFSSWRNCPIADMVFASEVVVRV
jgi:hypothetical protein